MKPLGLHEPKDEGNKMTPCPASPKTVEYSSIMDGQSDRSSDALENCNKISGQFDMVDSRESSKELKMGTDHLKNLNGLCNGINVHSASTGLLSGQTLSADSNAVNVATSSSLSLSIPDLKFESSTSSPNNESPLPKSSLSPRAGKNSKRPSLECLVARLYHRVVFDKLNPSGIGFLGAENSHAPAIKETSEINLLDKEQYSRKDSLKNEQNNLFNQETCTTDSAVCSSVTSDTYLCSVNTNLGSKISTGSCSIVAQEEVCDGMIKCKKCKNFGHSCQCFSDLDSENLQNPVFLSKEIPFSGLSKCSKVLVLESENKENSLINCTMGTESCLSDATTTAEERFEVLEMGNKSTVVEKNDQVMKIPIKQNENVAFESGLNSVAQIENQNTLTEDTISDFHTSAASNHDDKNAEYEGKESDKILASFHDASNDKLCDGFESKLTTSASSTPLFSDTPSDASQSEMMVKISDAVAALLSNTSKQVSPESSLDTRLKGNSDTLFSDSNSPAEPFQSNINFSCAFKILDLLPEKSIKIEDDKPLSSLPVAIEMKEKLYKNSQNQEQSNGNSCKEPILNHMLENKPILVNKEDKSNVNNNDYSGKKEYPLEFQYSDNVSSCVNTLYKDNTSGESSNITDETSETGTLLDEVKESEPEIRKNGVKSLDFAKTIKCSSNDLDCNICLPVDNSSHSQNQPTNLSFGVEAANVCNDENGRNISCVALFKSDIGISVSTDSLDVQCSEQMVQKKTEVVHNETQEYVERNMNYYNEVLNCKKYLNLILNKECNYYSRLRASNANFPKGLQTSNNIPATVSDCSREESNPTSSDETEILEQEAEVDPLNISPLVKIDMKNYPPVDSPKLYNANSINVEKQNLILTSENLHQETEENMLYSKKICCSSNRTKLNENCSVESNESVYNDENVTQEQEKDCISVSEKISFINFLNRAKTYVSDMCILCSTFYDDLNDHCAQAHSCITYIPIYQTSSFIHHMRERTGKAEHSYSDESYSNPYYLCKSCGTLLKTMNSVRLHLNTHQDIFLIQSSTYSCLCNKKKFYYLPYKLKNFLMQSEFVCSFCQNYFSCEKSLYLHLRIMHFNKDVCSKCNVMVSSEDEDCIIKHNIIHLNEGEDISKYVAPVFEESMEHIWDQSHFSWNALDNQLNYIDGKAFRLNVSNSNNADNVRQNLSLPLKVDPAFVTLPNSCLISPMVDMMKYTKSKLNSKLTNSDVDSYASKELEMNIQYLLQKRHSRKLRKKKLGTKRKKIPLPLLLELNPLLKKRNFIPVGFEDKEEMPRRRCKYARKAKTKIQKKRILEKIQNREEEENSVILSRTRSGMRPSSPQSITEEIELNVPLTEITGEWGNFHTFVCCSCGAVFLDLADIMDHKWEAHPGVWCAHTMIQGQDSVPKLFYEQYLPPHSRGNASAVTAKPKESKKENFVCSHCDLKFTSQENFHNHIIDCGGLSQIEISKKKLKNKKGLRFRRRKLQGIPSRRYCNSSLVSTPHKISSEKGSGTSTPNREISGYGGTSKTSSVVRRKLSLASGSVGRAELKSKLRTILSGRNKMKKTQSLSRISRKRLGMRLRKRVDQQQQMQQQRQQQMQQQRQQQKQRAKEPKKPNANLSETRPRHKRKSQLQLLKEAQTFQKRERSVSLKTGKRISIKNKFKTGKARARRKSVEVLDLEKEEEDERNDIVKSKKLVNILRRKSTEVMNQDEDNSEAVKPSKSLKRKISGAANIENTNRAIAKPKKIFKKTKLKSVEVIDAKQDADVDFKSKMTSNIRKFADAKEDQEAKMVELKKSLKEMRRKSTESASLKQKDVNIKSKNIINVRRKSVEEKEQGVKVAKKLLKVLKRKSIDAPSVKREVALKGEMNPEGNVVVSESKNMSFIRRKSADARLEKVSEVKPKKIVRCMKRKSADISGKEQDQKTVVNKIQKSSLNYIQRIKKMVRISYKSNRCLTVPDDGVVKKSFHTLKQRLSNKSINITSKFRSRILNRKNRKGSFALLKDHDQEDTKDQYQEDAKDQYQEDAKDQYQEDAKDQHQEDAKNQYQEDAKDQHQEDAKDQYQEDAKGQYQEDTNDQHQEDANAQHQEDTKDHRQDDLNSRSSPKVLNRELHNLLTNEVRFSRCEAVKKMNEDSDSASEPEIITNFRRRRVAGRSGLRSRKTFVPRYSLRPSVGDHDEGSDVEEIIIKPCDRVKRKYNIGDDDTDEAIRRDQHSMDISIDLSAIGSLKRGPERREIDPPAGAVVSNKRRKSNTWDRISETESLKGECKNKDESQNVEKAKVNRRKAYHTFKYQNSKVSRFYYMARKKFSRLKFSCQTTDMETSSGCESITAVPVKKRKLLPKEYTADDSSKMTSTASSGSFKDLMMIGQESSNVKVAYSDSYKDFTNVELSKIVSESGDSSKVKFANVNSGKMRSMSIDCPITLSNADTSDVLKPPKLPKSTIKKRRCSDPLPKASVPNSETTQPNLESCSEVKHKRKYVKKCLKPKKKMFLTPETIESECDSDSLSDVPLSARMEKKKSNCPVGSTIRDKISHHIVSDSQNKACKRKRGVKGHAKKRSRTDLSEDLQTKTKSNIEAESLLQIEPTNSCTEEAKVVKPKRKYTFKKKLLAQDGNLMLKSKNKKVLKEVCVLSYKSLNTEEETPAIEGKGDNEIPEELKKPIKTKRPYVRKNRKVDENSPAVVKPKRRRKKEVEPIEREEEVIGFLCNECGLSFDSALSREDHRQDCRNIAFEMSLMAEDYLFECPYCQLTFALKGTHRKHITSCRMRRSRKNGQRRRKAVAISHKNERVESKNPCYETLSPKKRNANVPQVEEGSRESSVDLGLIGNRLVSHCQIQAGMREIGSLLLEHKLCTNGMRYLLTSSSSDRETDTIIHFKDSASVSSYSQGYSYQILQDILGQTKLYSLSEEFTKTAVSLQGNAADTNSSITVNFSRSDLLKALSNLEDLLKEAAEVESSVKRQQMLLSMKETFQADTGS